MESSWTLDECNRQGFPRLRYVARGIGKGLGVACTEDDSGILLWVAEVRCHPFCIVTGEAKCTYSLDILERSKIAKKVHTEWLTRLPAYVNIPTSALLPTKKGNEK
jgi:hypothetical protein